MIKLDELTTMIKEEKEEAWMINVIEDYLSNSIRPTKKGTF